MKRDGGVKFGSCALRAECARGPAVRALLSISSPSLPALVPRAVRGGDEKRDGRVRAQGCRPGVLRVPRGRRAPDPLYPQRVPCGAL